MKQETFLDKICGYINGAYEWLTRMLLTCDGNRCGGSPLIFEEDDEGLFPLRVIDSEGETKIYVYFCPWCGRRLANKGQ